MKPKGLMDYGFGLGEDASPLFSPQHHDVAKAELLDVIHRSPRLYNLPRSRWWLDGLRQVIRWLRGLSLAGIHRILRRLGVVYKRGRRYLHSPDPAYDTKMARLAECLALTTADPTHFVFLYEDELSYYRRATVGYGYTEPGRDSLRADQGFRGSSRYRIAGSLDVTNGRFFAWQRYMFDRKTLIAYFQALDAQYPVAKRIFVALDNWPVHFNPDILEALSHTRIELLRLPTYAPWTNPVEKVWRKLYQEVLHLHSYVNDWDGLKDEVEQWLQQFTSASPVLLRYTGLLEN